MAKKSIEVMQERKLEKIEEKVRKKEEEKVEEKKEESKKEEKKKVEVKKPQVDYAKAKAEYLPISTKHAVEISKWIRGKDIKKVYNLLNEVLEMKKAVPFVRYNKEVPHKKGKGVAAGRYPVKAVKYIKEVIDNAVANAKYLNLDESKLYLKSIIPNQGVSRKRGGKYTHIEVIVAERK